MLCFKISTEIKPRLPQYYEIYVLYSNTSKIESTFFKKKRSRKPPNSDTHIQNHRCAP